MFPFALLGSLAAVAASPVQLLARDRAQQLNDAVRNMALSPTAKQMFGDFAWSLTDGILEQPFHSWYVLVDPEKVGTDALKTTGLPHTIDQDPAPYKAFVGGLHKNAGAGGGEQSVRANKSYFDMIRRDGAGNRLRAVLEGAGKGSAADVTDDVELWKLLMQSMKMGGVDFEHQFGILRDEAHTSAADAAAAALRDYTFPEIMLSTRSVLFIPALQHVEPMARGMFADELTDVGAPRPMLTVGLVAGAVKGPVYTYLAENTPELALELADTNHVGRQICAIVRTILTSGLDNWVLFSTLPGAGAFATDPGARENDIGPKYFEGLSHALLPEKAHAKRVSLFGALFIGIDEQISQLNTDIGSEMVTRNPQSGIGAKVADDEWGVIVGGFDPVALVPHAARLRSISGEGQLGAGITLFETLGGYAPGSLVKAEVAMRRNVAKPKAKPSWVDDAKAVRLLPKEYVDFCGSSAGAELWLVPSGDHGKQGDDNDSKSGWDLACKKGSESLKLWKTPFELLGKTNAKKSSGCMIAMMFIIVGVILVALGVMIVVCCLVGRTTEGGGEEQED